ncbi:MAG: dockerin type I repeat-containing protein, partial [Prevotella sp.]|nr:dockerin type I repeat-containing protein [Prevotella sp.]
DGAIRLVTLAVDETAAEGVYPIIIQNATYSKPDGSIVTLPETTTTITLENYILGDVNGNNGVDIGDAVTIVNYLVGKETSNFVEKAADMNKNGGIDIGDAVTIVNFLVGKTTSLSRQAETEWNGHEPQ